MRYLNLFRFDDSHLSVVLFQDGLMDEMYELILEHLVVHSHTISFPELALPVILKVSD